MSTLKAQFERDFKNLVEKDLDEETFQFQVRMLAADFLARTGLEVDGEYQVSRLGSENLLEGEIAESILEIKTYFTYKPAKLT